MITVGGVSMSNRVCGRKLLFRLNGYVSKSTTVEHVAVQQHRVLKNAKSHEDERKKRDVLLKV